MPRVGFEPMPPEVQRAQTVHALDIAAPVIGFHANNPSKLKNN
jgi:hypothetical protein